MRARARECYVYVSGREGGGRGGGGGRGKLGRLGRGGRRGEAFLVDRTECV